MKYTSRYTNAEMPDIHFMKGRDNGIAYEAQRLYAEAFPNHLLPPSKLLSKLQNRLSESGAFIVTKCEAGRPRSLSYIPENEINVLRKVEENPQSISLFFF